MVLAQADGRSNEKSGNLATGRTTRRTAQANTQVCPCVYGAISLLCVAPNRSLCEFQRRSDFSRRAHLPSRGSFAFPPPWAGRKPTRPRKERIRRPKRRVGNRRRLCPCRNNCRNNISNCSKPLI